jgi:hypothetical protein
MEKEDKVFWSYFTSILIFVEIGINLSLNQSPTHWQIVRLACIILNVSIVMYLLYARKKKEKLNEENNQTYEVSQAS